MRSHQVTDKIRAILDERKVPRRQHITTVSNILGLRYVSTQQKFSGLKSWTPDQLAKISDYFKIDSSSLGINDVGYRRFAIFSATNPPQRCLAEIDYRPNLTGIESLVAYEENERWQISSQAAIPEGARGHAVTSLKFLPPPRLAALDDDAGIPRAIAAEFRFRGIHVEQFTCVSDLLDADRKEPFDGYVLDWLLEKRQTAEEVIVEVCNHQRRAPIVVLTGQLETETVSQSDLSIMVEKYGVTVLAKPAPLKILATTFYKAFFIDPDGSVGISTGI